MAKSAMKYVEMVNCLFYSATIIIQLMEMGVLPAVMSKKIILVLEERIKILRLALIQVLSIL